MTTRSVLTMKRVQILLAIAGALTLAFGAVLLATDAVASPFALDRADSAHGDAVYVGSNTCFTCHPNEVDLHWDADVHTAVIQDPVVNPVAADFSTGADVRQLEISGETRAYTAQDIAFIMSGTDRQRYVMRTEDGFTLLPGQWDTVSRRWTSAAPGDWLGECAGCHSTGFVPAVKTFAEIGVTCEACHGPASTHVELASALSSEAPVGLIEQIRQSIALTIDADVCTQCHIGGVTVDFTPADEAVCPQRAPVTELFIYATLPVVTLSGSAAALNLNFE